MTEQKIPELRIGKIDGVWTVAMADRFGWVEVGSGEPLDETLVAYDWTPLVPAPPVPRVFGPVRWVRFNAAHRPVVGPPRYRHRSQRGVLRGRR